MANEIKSRVDAPTLTPLQAEFNQKLRECLHAFPYTQQGERQLHAYSAERRVARAHYDKLISDTERGENVTDAVLSYLLPYADTRPNRDINLWISHTGALKRDIRAWFAQTPWGNAVDWNEAASAILHFVRRCVEHPEQVEDACTEFNALPYTRGLQMGLLTPILCALRPDTFVLINEPARRMLAYFADIRLSMRLADYPRANAAAWRLLNNIPADLRDPALPDADLFDMLASWLIGIRHWRPATHHFWHIAVNEDSALWTSGIREGFVAIPIEQVPERLLRRISENDDLVAHSSPCHNIGLGVISGPPFRVGEMLRLPMIWQNTRPLDIARPGWRGAFGQANQQIFIDLRARMISNGPATLTIQESGTPYEIANKPASYADRLMRAASKTMLPIEEIDHWAHAIERKGQGIIYGPPGTGKTFLAEQLATILTDPSDGLIEWLQLHPAYAYEDFMQGLRPLTNADGVLYYAMLPGRFMDFCKRAEQRATPSILILDEINRADLGRIFGEALSLLEYRDRHIDLAAGGSFAIPTQVRIIGTMNTADRSIALVDRALRRRFIFIPLEPRYDVLTRYHEQTGYAIEPLIALLQRINASIGDPDYALGISYFMHVNLADVLPDIWQYEITPLLAEYFLEQPHEMERWKWENVQNELQAKTRRRRSR
jgi:AAA domain (dynein-related subfamily)